MCWCTLAIPYYPLDYGTWSSEAASSRRAARGQQLLVHGSAEGKRRELPDGSRGGEAAGALIWSEATRTTPRARRGLRQGARAHGRTSASPKSG